MNIGSRFDRRLVAIMLGTTSLAVVGSPAFAQEMPDCDPESEECSTDQAEAADQSEVADPNAATDQGEIVVTGIRAAIENATNNKKNSDQIKDVIDAEDIGKLPDTNVAEALQRVTGVQINRELGEGSEIAVRGFSQNRVEVNGQTQVGAGSSGTPTFQTIASEAFKNIEVIKAPAADEIEGALGAIIRFNTRKPLDSKTDLLSFSGDAQYADRASKWTSNLNALASTQTTTGEGTRLGALFNFTYKGRKLRQDFLDLRGWDAVNGFGQDLDGDGVAGEAIERDEDGVITNLQDGAFVPMQARLRIREQDRDLYSGTVSLQAITDYGFELYFDSTYTMAKNGDTQFQYTTAFNSALAGGAGSRRLRTVYQQPENAVISPDQTVLSAFLGEINPATGGPKRGVNLNIAGNSNPAEREVWSLSTGFNWQVSDRLEMKLNYARGQGWTENDQLFSSTGVGFGDWPFYYYDFAANTDVPTIVPLIRSVDGQALTEFSDDARLDLLSISSYTLNNVVVQLQRERTLESAWRMDFDWDVDWGPIRTLEFGGRLTSERGRRYRFRAYDGPGAADGTLGAQSLVDLEARFPGLTVQQPYDDVLDGASGDFPRNWFSLSSNYIQDNLFYILDEAGINPTRDAGWGFDVDRDTKAAYAKAKYEFTIGDAELFGNFGLRYVSTDRTANGAIAAGSDVFIPLTVDKSYDNWLPSFNLVADTGDGYFARLGVAKAMSRPSLTDLAPLVNIQFFSGSGVGGNPNLLPEEVTQIDLSFEKYYGRSNLISVALFYKDFSERIEGGVSIDCYPVPSTEIDTLDDGCAANFDSIAVATPVNAGEAEVKGVEVGWQQSLDFLPGVLSGFGFIANYTFVDADDASGSLSGLSLPVQELSKHSYNLVGYYEKYGVQARLAYNWRSEFYDTRTDTNFASFAEDYGQLDASLGYNITPDISVSVEALNILNSAEIRYQEVRERLIAYRVNDRRVLFGVRWKM